jgi:hypothetical protein
MILLFAMDALTRTRLLNLLARTASEHDAEALTAVRKANQLLGRHALVWSEVIPIKIPDPVARPAATAGATTKPAGGAGSDRHPSAGASAWGARHPKSHHWSNQRKVFSRPTRMQRIARMSPWLGLGSGILFGAVGALFAIVADDDVDLYELAGIGFALPVLVGFALWVVLGGWLLRHRVTR